MEMEAKSLRGWGKGVEDDRVLTGTTRALRCGAERKSKGDAARECEGEGGRSRCRLSERDEGWCVRRTSPEPVVISIPSVCDDACQICEDFLKRHIFHTPHGTCYTLHVTLHTSHLTLPTSHVTLQTSHAARFTYHRAVCL